MFQPFILVQLKRQLSWLCKTFPFSSRHLNVCEVFFKLYWWQRGRGSLEETSANTAFELFTSNSYNGENTQMDGHIYC